MRPAAAARFDQQGILRLQPKFYYPFFVSLSAALRENGWTDLHEIFREGVE